MSPAGYWIEAPARRSAARGATREQRTVRRAGAKRLSPALLLVGMGVGGPGLFVTGGCVSGSLASDTGPRSPDARWSTASRQQILPGESVRFDFILTDPLSGVLVSPSGVADYAVLLIGRERLETEPDLYGHFTFTYLFDRAPPGERIRASAAAYRQRRRRDFMRIGDEWMHSESPDELEDKRVAGDEIVFEVYQPVVRLTIGPAGREFDPETGVLKLLRDDGTAKQVYIHRPGRPGFLFEGPGPDGRCVVTYAPTADEANASGRTRAEFLVYDVAGQPHDATAWLDTP